MTSYHIKENVDFSFIKRVAILPLDNFTSNKSASEAVRQVVTTEMLSSGFVDVVVPGDVMAAINNVGVKSISSPSVEEIRALGKFLKVEAVVTGSVDNYAEVRRDNVTVAEVSITLMMVDTGAGDILWSVTKTSPGAGFMARHFGARTPTLSEATSNIVREAIATLSSY
ncbi:MAG: hypothetical protein HY807_06225 [Nitrospirae bacterium]|nr:hypothetical protein [Nitrospirota bacterium]